MKKIREALERYADPDIQNQHGYKKLMGVDDTIIAKEALAELDQIEERLESESLLEEVAKTLMEGWDVNDDDYTFEEAAQAAINTISKQLTK